VSLLRGCVLLVLPAALGCAGAAPGPPPRAPAADLDDLDDLLERLLDADHLATAPEAGERTVLSSSFDRRSLAGREDPTAWYANDDWGNPVRAHVGADGEEEWVLAEADGPGYVARIWSANPKGTLRFRVDGAETPVLEVPFQELCRGDDPRFPAPLAGIFGRGWNALVPLPFAESLLLTCTEKDFYFQVDLHLLPPGTRTPSLSPDLLERHGAAIRRTAAELAARMDEPIPGPPTAPLAPGATLARRFRGAGVVRRTTVSLAGLPDGARGAAVLRGLRLRITADGAAAPQVDVPLGDFFGSAPGLLPHRSALLAVEVAGDEAVLDARLPLPFADGLLVEVVNESDHPVALGLATVLGPTPPGPLRLHAAWRSWRDVPTRPFRDLVFLDAEGPGRLVGALLTIRNPVRAWWGEGDAHLYVDDEAFPSQFGTGTEDDFGYAWCCPVPFDAPFHFQARCDGPGNRGWTAVARLRLLDAVPFRRRLRWEQELWHWADTAVDLAVTTWWYAPAAAGHAGPPLPPWKDRIPRPLPPLAVWHEPGVLEAEGLRARADAGTLQPQDMSGFPADRWSGDAQLWWTEGRLGDRLRLELPLPASGRRFRVRARFTTARDYARVRVRLGADGPTTDLDLWSEEVRATDPVDLGIVSAGPRRTIPLVVEITGRHPRAVPGLMVGLDWVRVEPVE